MARSLRTSSRCHDIAEIADLLRPFTEVAVEATSGCCARVAEAHTAFRSTPPAVPCSCTSRSWTVSTRIPVYGVERTEGPLAERAAGYLDRIREIADGRAIAVGLVSGGALAVRSRTSCGRRARDRAGRGGHRPAVGAIPDTLDEAEARWKRYSSSPRRPTDSTWRCRGVLAEHGEDGVLACFEALGAEANAMGGGVIEHQRASFVDNRSCQSADRRGAPTGRCRSSCTGPSGCTRARSSSSPCHVLTAGRRSSPTIVQVR